MSDADIMEFWKDENVRHEFCVVQAKLPSAWTENHRRWGKWLQTSRITCYARELPNGYHVMVAEDSANGEVILFLLDRQRKQIAEAKA
ncbi:MAG: hypothetical protein LBB86_01230 [Oscillospiraceae bacterium]|jgi:hypothetical protein|nr:hypothetical protein [Oscillospiraceae bacterium]